MKVADMKNKSAKDLAKHADKLRQSLAETRSSRFIAEQKNVKKIGAMRKELARTLTFLKQQEDNLLKPVANLKAEEK